MKLLQTVAIINDELLKHNKRNVDTKEIICVCETMIYTSYPVQNKKIHRRARFRYLSLVTVHKVLKYST